MPHISLHPDKRKCTSWQSLYVSVGGLEGVGSSHCPFGLTPLNFIFSFLWLTNTSFRALRSSSTSMRHLINNHSHLNFINTEEILVSALYFVIQIHQFIGRLKVLFMALQLLNQPELWVSIYEARVLRYHLHNWLII